MISWLIAVPITLFLAWNNDWSVYEYWMATCAFAIFLKID